MAAAPIIKWETRPWTDVIRRVECERESGSSLWVIDEWPFGERKARIRRKSSGRWTFHDTWEDAHSHLMEMALERVAELQRKVAQAKERYQRCLHMTKPAEPESEAPTRESGD